jgi:hypothetical protein
MGGGFGAGGGMTGLGNKQAASMLKRVKIEWPADVDVTFKTDVNLLNAFDTKSRQTATINAIASPGPNYNQVNCRSSVPNPLALIFRCYLRMV